eukprot:Tbor_TRINITY_DN8235_c0_g1::TRINITY_DN8235_c0_g1_i1::g.15402::m.15402
MSTAKKHRGEDKPTSNGSSTSGAPTVASPLILPKTVLERCKGTQVAVMLKNDHELYGILQQLDESCNLSLADVIHYHVVYIGDGGNSDNAKSSSTNANITQVQRKAANIVMKRRIIRECGEVLVNGSFVEQIVPNPPEVKAHEILM